MKMAVFPCKMNPIHVGHLVQIRRLIDRYDLVCIDILNDERFMSSIDETKDIIHEIFKYTIHKIIFKDHFLSYVNTIPEHDFPYDDVVYVTGNNDVYDNLLKNGFNVKKIKRFSFYRSSIIRNMMVTVCNKEIGGNSQNGKNKRTSATGRRRI